MSSSPFSLLCEKCGIQYGPRQLFGLFGELRGDPSSLTGLEPRGKTAYPENDVKNFYHKITAGNT